MKIIPTYRTEKDLTFHPESSRGLASAAGFNQAGDHLQLRSKIRSERGRAQTGRHGYRSRECGAPASIGGGAAGAVKQPASTEGTISYTATTLLLPTLTKTHHHHSPRPQTTP